MGAWQKLSRWYRKTLYRKLLVSRILLLLFFLLFFGFNAYIISLGAIRSEVNLRNDKLAILEAKVIDTEINNIIANLQLFSYQIEYSSVSLIEQARILVQFRRISPLTYRALYLFDSLGGLLVRVDAPFSEILRLGELSTITGNNALPLDNRVKEAFKSAQNEIVYVSETSISGIDQIPTLFLAFLVQMESNKNNRVMVAQIDLRDIWLKIDELTIGETGHALVVSRQGTIIAHPDRSYIGRQIESQLKQVMDGYEGRVEYYDPFAAKWKLASFSPVGGSSGWSVIVEQNRDEIFTPVYMIIYVLIIIFILAIIIGTIITNFTTKSITNPINHLVSVTRNIIQTGNLHQEISISGDDEIAELAQVFNQMIEHVREAEQKLQIYSEQLEERVETRTQDLSRTQELLKKHTDDLENAVKDLESFSYSVSHDLRAPLRAINGFVSVLSEDYVADLPPQAHYYIERVEKNVEKMSQLVDDLLAFSRLGRQAVNKRTVDMVDIVHQVIEELKAIQNDRDIEIIVDNLPQCEVDPNLFKSVLFNLLSNSFKFTQKCAHAKIEIGWSKLNDQVVYFIRDNGVGFDMAYYDRLFGVFQRLHRAEEFEGTGVGLAIVQRIIKKHGGKVWAEAEINKGATFYFSLS